MLSIPSTIWFIKSYRLWCLALASAMLRGKQASNRSTKPRRCLPQGRNEESSTCAIVLPDENLRPIA